MPSPAGAMIVVVALLAAVAAALAARLAQVERRRRARRGAPGGRILFPLTAGEPPAPVLDAALRIARAERATLVPAYLATVPLILPLDAAVPRQAERALALLEVVERAATRAGVAVEGRIERGRTVRHALAELLRHEPHDRLVLAAAATGFGPDDIAWALAHGDGEVLVLRPAGARGAAAGASPSASTPAVSEVTPGVAGPPRSAR